MNPVLRYSASSSLFGLFSAAPIQKDARRAGFEWDDRGFFKSSSPYRAIQFAQYADQTAKRALRPYLQAVAESQATDSILEIPAPAGLEYMPFQKAGIAYASRRMNTLLGDEPGLGKTIQAIGLANYLGLSRLLVVCPAGLRLNWALEIAKWHLRDGSTDVLLDGKGKIRPHRSTIVSYDLAVRLRADLMRQQYDLVILDECLSVIRALAPETIDSMNFHAFRGHYAIVKSNGFGDKVVGIRHEAELYQRLRAGFMVRRLKADVLKDLPDKTYKMVVFDKSGFKSVLNRERQFSAAEILSRGLPVGSALPEIRREMGIAKAPLVSQYVEDLLEDGTEKVIVFAHHREVVEALARNLSRYRPLTITGATTARDRQAGIDSFQKGDNRVIICNLVAGGVGVTLTRAADVIFAEASWVPGEHEQAEDRAHRIGQTRGVLVHHLVVEGSLDAAILGSAAMKRKNIRTILDGGEK